MNYYVLYTSVLFLQKESSSKFSNVNAKLCYSVKFHSVGEMLVKVSFQMVNTFFWLRLYKIALLNDTFNMIEYFVMILIQY
jgi:hypothetical protein